MIRYPGKDFWFGVFGLFLFGDGDFPLDVFQQELLTLQKVHVGKLHFVFVQLQTARFNRDHLVESIHVELPDKTGHVVVLVILRQ